MQQQQQQEDDAAAAADGSNADEQQQQPADEYQFLNQADQETEGTTQALAPATEEQAAQQQDQQANLSEQQQQQQQGAGGDEDQDLAQQAQAMDEDEPGPDAGQDEKLAQGPLAQQTWATGHKKQQPNKQQQQQDDAAAAGEDGVDSEGEQQQGEDPQQQLLAAAAAASAAAAAAADTDTTPSEVAARLAAAQLTDGPALGLEAEQAQLLSSQLPAEEAEALRAQLDIALRDAATAAASGAGADGAHDASTAAYGREMWARCEALVSGLAGELTEQLRLILEPSLASRLGGEYRSGKRLNMKRVIGYIASQFRRDKIWMRRSRPDKRRYQVVVAVDDSRSMAENGAACFALEALSLLCKAMSRLDVGELGVISYGGGSGVKPLQALEVPFTDAAGPGIMSSLRFDQDNTIADRPMLQLVEAVQHLLEGARVRAGSQSSSGSSSDLRQLLLVLGDGRFHEKDALVGAVRKLVEVQGVCPVFIALDSAATAAAAAVGSSKGAPGGSNAAAAAGVGASSNGGSSGGSRASSSLLDMQSVKFVDGKPVFERYMDTFPFPYYIVLRDIAALPATLADLLRQWFELNASSS
jgi:midasin